MSEKKANQQMTKGGSQAEASEAGAKFRAGGQKVLAFTLMLTVPIALSGCNTASPEECYDYDDNNYCDDDGSSAYISNGKKYKKSSSYSSGSSSSKGFGSSGISGSSGG
jgi:hypothetical protein